jgi:hypothetical protein
MKHVNRILLISMALLLATSAAEACLCNESWPTKASADADFVAIAMPVATTPFPHYTRYRFALRKVLKGSAGDSIDIGTRTTSCSEHFAVGTLYLVFAHGGVQELTTSQCAGNMPAEFAARGLDTIDPDGNWRAWLDTVDRRELDDSTLFGFDSTGRRAPKEKAAVENQEDRGFPTTLAIGATALLGAGILVALRLRNHGSSCDKALEPRGYSRSSRACPTRR